MKYSEVEWIGNIPDDWEITKSKYVASTYTGNSIKDEVKNNYENKSDDTVPYIATKDIDGTSLKINYENLLYINKADKSFVRAHFGDTLMCVEGGSAGRKKTYLTENEVCFVNKLCCFHSFNINSKYLYYILSSPHYESEFKLNITGLIGGVSRAKLDNFYIPFPDIITQQKIAEYLDKKCGQVDGLIANQQAQIEKLKQYKQSVITEAVTRGLTSSPLKDSGIDWIGSIPEHWKIVKNKVIFKKVSVKGYGSATVLSLYRDLGVVPKDSRDDNHNVTSLDTDSYKYVQDGDLVINKMKAWSGSLAISDYEGIVSPAYHICKVNYRYVDKRFIHHYLRNRNIVQVYEKLSSGMRIGQWDLQIDDFLNIDIGIPKSLDEQQQIADYLDNKCGEIDRLISLKQQKIDALTSYKKSLIYEYVTGKKEVV